MRPPLVTESLVIIVSLSSVSPFSHHLSGLRRFYEAGLGKSMGAQEGHSTWLALFQAERAPIATSSFSRRFSHQKLYAVLSSEAANPSHWYPIVVRLSKAARREYRMPILRCLALYKISGLIPGRGHDLQLDSGFFGSVLRRVSLNGRSHLPLPISNVASFPAMRHLAIPTISPTPRRRAGLFDVNALAVNAAAAPSSWKTF